MRDLALKGSRLTLVAADAGRKGWDATSRMERSAS